MARMLLASLAAGVALLIVVPVVLAAAAASTPGGTPSMAAHDEIPPTYLALYQQAAASRCPSLSWAVLAGVGYVESRHGTLGGAQTAGDGTVAPPIIGPALDGIAGTARILDTDGGRYDRDPVYDHAVGPMQFIPETWTAAGLDASADGITDPHNAIDAIHSTAAHLCELGAGNPTRLRTALFAYNHSLAYVADVLAAAARYTQPVPVDAADPELIAAVLDNPRLTIYQAGRDDIAAGRIDARILALLQTLSQQWTLGISSLYSGHSRCVGGGNYDGCTVSEHYHGRAVDIHRVNAQPVASDNRAAFELVASLAQLPARNRPGEVGSPWPTFDPLPGFFSDAAHADHLHLAAPAG